MPALPYRRGLTAAILGLSLGLPLAASAETAKGPTARDIVLDRLQISPLPIATPPAAGNDAMAVSVLVEALDGSLTPRSTETLFSTGERFRVKVMASRPGRISLFNTNPRGEFNPNPIWQGQVAPGQETVSPRLVLDGNSGTDLLHVVLEPEQAAAPQGVIAWLQGLLRGNSRDIKLDVQNTNSATYIVNPVGQGVTTTVRIVHR